MSRAIFGAVVFSLATASAGADTGASGVVPHAELRQLVRTCAADVSPTTQAAIVSVESGGDAWALHDDNDGAVYAPQTYEQARALADELLARDRSRYGAADRGVDVGLAQINSVNFASLGVSAATMLEPCENLRASARIIRDAYVRERAILASDPTARGDQTALRRALQVYNSGQDSGDDEYVRAIFSAAAGPLARDAGDAVPASVAPRGIARLRASQTAVLGRAMFVSDGYSYRITEPRRPAHAASAPIVPSRAAGDGGLRSGRFVHVETDGVTSPASGLTPWTPTTSGLATPAPISAAITSSRSQGAAFVQSGGDVDFQR